jgi:hypothetical protein
VCTELVGVARADHYAATDWHEQFRCKFAEMATQQYTGLACRSVSCYTVFGLEEGDLDSRQCNGRVEEQMQGRKEQINELRSVYYISETTKDRWR